MKISRILENILHKPKAIFLAGAAGSGKSWILKQIIPDLSSFTIINVDDTYEKLLRSSGLGVSQKDFTPDQLSQAAKLMGSAQKATKEKLQNTLNSMSNIIIDGTGAASRPLLKKKQDAEALGYESFMVMVYVSPITSLKRNYERERNLLPSIILKTWAGAYNNINEFKSAFGNNFVLVDNNPEDADKGFDDSKIKPFFSQSSAKGKPKTPEEQAKSLQQRQELNAQINSLVQNEPETDDINTAKTKITQFLK